MKTIAIKKETWKRIKKQQASFFNNTDGTFSYTQDEIINFWADAYESVCGKRK